MKTLWICGLLFLLPIAAFSWISVALSGAGEPLSEARASPSIAALPPPLNTPVEADARDLSEYVFLHETRNEIARRNQGAMCANARRILETGP